MGKRVQEWLWVLLPVVLVVGWFYPIVGLSALVCMLGPVIMAIRRGRFWCGNICPRGMFLGRFMKGLGPDKEIPSFLKGRVARVVVIVGLMGMLSVQVAKAWPDPAAIGFVLWRMVLVTTTVGVVLALLSKPRSWCSVCPVGTMSSWLARDKGYLKVSESCKSCGLCVKACPMGLTPYMPDASHKDCLACGKCVGKCPFGALSLGDDPEGTNANCGTVARG